MRNLSWRGRGRLESALEIVVARKVTEEYV